MAKISTIKEALLICKDADITPFIWGNRGLGKSSLVQQVAAQNNWGFIDFRCSQIESSDIRGLPDRIDGRTHYLPPVDMPIGDLTIDDIKKELGTLEPDSDINTKRLYYDKFQLLQPRFQHGILFLDEVNRAQDDVLQAIFQLILDRKIGMYVLPPGWCVVAAGNYNEGYRVGGFDDPAFLNRFCHLILAGGETTLEEWVNYMSVVHGGNATDVIEFASQNTKHLDGDIGGELGFSIQPSRRSWEMVIKVQQVCEAANYNEIAKSDVIAGLIGRELALSFSRYSCPVKPRELIVNGVKKYEKKLKDLSRNELTGLMWGLVSHCKHQIDDDNIANVCLDFASYMINITTDKDIIVAFCRALVSGGNVNDRQEQARAAVISNPRLAKMISKFNKASGDKKLTFIDRLSARPDFKIFWLMLHGVLMPMKSK